MDRSDTSLTIGGTDTAAIILAGGKGTRLRPVYSSGQKATAPVGDKPFLYYILSHLNRFNMHHATICVGYKADEVEQSLGRSCAGVDLSYSREESPLGTAGAIAKAYSTTGSKNLLVLNGDTYCPIDLNQFARHYAKSDTPFSIASIEVEDSSRYGLLEIDENERVSNFREKDKNAGSGWINAGVYLFSRDIAESIPPNTNCSIEREILPRLANERKISVFKSPAKFIDIGTPESFAKAQQLEFLS